MGTHFFKAGNPGMTHPSSLNMMARSISAPSFAGNRAMSQSKKDLGAASGLYKAKKLSATTKDAASAAPGPKKV